MNKDEPLPPRRIRTLIAEDSTTVRGLLISILGSDPAFEIVGEAANGEEAIRKARRLKPDLITMDVNMPVIDGIDATKAIMLEVPTPILIVTAAAGSGNVELSLNAMHAGALMVVDKPVDPNSSRFNQQSEQLIAMAKAMAEVKVVRRWGPGQKRLPIKEGARQESKGGIRLVAIGASAGGPAALKQLLSSLPRDFPVPVIVVQHIARGFIDGLCRWLGLNCVLPVKVASEGIELEASTIYLAPDNYHLGFTSSYLTWLNDGPPLNGFKPSVDFLFESCARVYGSNCLGVILTGMGNDGTKGLTLMHQVGCKVLAQDENTSIVYGMAREAVRAGAVDEVLPLDRIAPRIVELVNTL